MLGDYGGYFWVYMITGNVWFYLVCFDCLPDYFGLPKRELLWRVHDGSEEQIKRERRILRNAGKVSAVPMILICISFFVITNQIQGEMDLPDILSGTYYVMEGTVQDYKPNNSYGEGKAKIKENETGKVFSFTNILVPKFLKKGDQVKMCYLRYSKIAVFSSVNGISIEFEHDRNLWGGALCVAFLFLYIPLYSAYYFKLKPALRSKKNYEILLYNDIAYLGLWGLYIFMVQGANILLRAMFGYYKQSWRWYWYVLIVIYYVGVFAFYVIKNKDFVIEGDEFSYCGFKQRVEGKLEEIVSCEETEKGVLIRTEKESMMIYCGKKEKREELLERLGSRAA